MCDGDSHGLLKDLTILSLISLPDPCFAVFNFLGSYHDLALIGGPFVIWCWMECLRSVLLYVTFVSSRTSFNNDLHESSRLLFITRFMETDSVSVSLIAVVWPPFISLWRCESTSGSKLLRNLMPIMGTDTSAMIKSRRYGALRQKSRNNFRMQCLNIRFVCRS